MSQTQISQAPSGEGKIPALEELVERVKVVEKAINEILPYIMELDNIGDEPEEKISEILEVAVPSELIYDNLFKIEDVINTEEIYEKYFPGWEDDECVHYLLVKLADDKYALIYSCSEIRREGKIRFSIAVNGEPVE